MIVELNHKDKATAEEIVRVEKLAYAVEADIIGFKNIPYRKESVEEVQNAQETFYGYKINDRLAGVISYQISDGELEVYRLVVRPQYFRQGVGSALIRYIMGQHNKKHAIWVAVAMKNEPGIAFYEKEGFSISKVERLHDEQLDIALMMKPANGKLPKATKTKA